MKSCQVSIVVRGEHTANDGETSPQTVDFAVLAYDVPSSSTVYDDERTRFF